jgi:hypothetical protein
LAATIADCPDAGTLPPVAPTPVFVCTVVACVLAAVLVCDETMLVLLALARAVDPEPLRAPPQPAAAAAARTNTSAGIKGLGFRVTKSRAIYRTSV